MSREGYTRIVHPHNGMRVARKKSCNSHTHIVYREPPQATNRRQCGKTKARLRQTRHKMLAKRSMLTSQFATTCSPLRKNRPPARRSRAQRRPTILSKTVCCRRDRRIKHSTCKNRKRPANARFAAKQSNELRNCEQRWFRPFEKWRRHLTLRWDRKRTLTPQ